MVLFTPQGQRGDAPARAKSSRCATPEVLTLGINAARPVSAVLADALAKPATLTANDWRLRLLVATTTTNR